MYPLEIELNGPSKSSFDFLPGMGRGCAWEFSRHPSRVDGTQTFFLGGFVDLVCLEQREAAHWQCVSFSEKDTPICLMDGSNVTLRQSVVWQVNCFIRSHLPSRPLVLFDQGLAVKTGKAVRQVGFPEIHGQT